MKVLYIQLNSIIRPSLSPTDFRSHTTTPSYGNISSYSSLSSTSSKDSTQLVQQQQQQQQQQKLHQFQQQTSPRNKSVVFILDKMKAAKIHSAAELKSSAAASDNDESNSLADSSFSSSSLSSSSAFHTANTQISINSQCSRSPPLKDNDLLSEISSYDEITTGKVKHLRNKFLNSDYNNNTEQNSSSTRRKSIANESIRNFQLKKCQSVIFNIDPTGSDTSVRFEPAKSAGIEMDQLRKRAQSNNCIDDLFRDNRTNINKNSADINSNKDSRPQLIKLKATVNESLIDETSVFDTCGVKERIRKFNNDFNNKLKNESISKFVNNKRLSSHTDQMKYGGSCNSLNLISKYSNSSVLSNNNNISNIIEKSNINGSKPNVPVIRVNNNLNNHAINVITNNNSNKKSSISSDADASNDDSNSTFSDDLTSSDMSCSEFKSTPTKPIIRHETSSESSGTTTASSNSYQRLNKTKQTNDKENLRADVKCKLVNDMTSFDENYKKIKGAFVSYYILN
jgi:hypothetical protein